MTILCPFRLESIMNINFEDPTVWVISHCWECQKRFFTDNDAVCYWFEGGAFCSICLPQIKKRIKDKAESSNKQS